MHNKTVLSGGRNSAGRLREWGCGHTADNWLLWRAPAAACKQASFDSAGLIRLHLCGLGAIGGSGRKADQSVVGTRQVGAALPALVRACGLGQTVMR